MRATPTLALLLCVAALPALACECDTQKQCDACEFELVLREMAVRKTSIDAQAHGCASLGSQVFKRIGRLDGTVAAVTGAMKAFPADVSSYKQISSVPPTRKLTALHRACCETLGKLAGAGLGYEISDESGAALVEAAMVAFPANPGVQNKAVLALGNLAQGSPENQAAIASSGAMLSTLAAMRAFGSDSLLQQHGCFVVAGLADGSQRRQDDLALAGGIELVIEAMRAHPSTWMVFLHLHERISGIFKRKMWTFPPIPWLVQFFNAELCDCWTGRSRSSVASR